MSDAEYKELLANLEKQPQRDDVVILEGKVLDGANRQKALLELKKPVRYREYDFLKDGADPLAFVEAKNLQRRNLTPSQRAAIAVDIAKMLEKFDKPKPGSTQTAAPGKPAASGAPLGATGAGTLATPKPGKEAKPKGKASVRAAKITGASPRSVERAAKIAKADPKAHADIKAGKTTLGAAEKKLTNSERAQRDRNDAIQRIKTVCGKSLAEAVEEGTRLKGKGEAAAYANLDDKKMIELRGLIENGWKLAAAMKYKLVSISKTHRISDLLTRAQAQGSSFELEIEGWTLTLTRKPAKK